MPDQNLARIRNGRRILTPDEARAKGAIELPPGTFKPGVRHLTAEQLAKQLPPEMIHETKRTCSRCATPFVETIIHPPDEVPKAREADERPDLCGNCVRRRRGGSPLLHYRRPTTPRQL